MQSNWLFISPNSIDSYNNDNCVYTNNNIHYLIASIPRREEKGGLHGILCMHKRVHYPKKGVIRVFVDTVSKINRILIVF